MNSGKGLLCALAGLPDLHPPGPSRSPQVHPLPSPATCPPPRPVPSLQAHPLALPPGAESANRLTVRPAHAASSRLPWGPRASVTLRPARGGGRVGLSPRAPGCGETPLGRAPPLEELQEDHAGREVGGALSDLKTRTGTQTEGAARPAPAPPSTRVSVGQNWAEASLPAWGTWEPPRGAILKAKPEVGLRREE